MAAEGAERLLFVVGGRDWQQDTSLQCGKLLCAVLQTLPSLYQVESFKGFSVQCELLYQVESFKGFSVQCELLHADAAKEGSQ